MPRWRGPAPSGSRGHCRGAVSRLMVVDASILANVIGDEGLDGRRARSEIRSVGELAAPDLVDVETAAVLRKRWVGGHDLRPPPCRRHRRPPRHRTGALPNAPSGEAELRLAGQRHVLRRDLHRARRGIGLPADRGQPACARTQTSLHGARPALTRTTCTIPDGGSAQERFNRQFRMTGADLPRPRTRALSGARYVPLSSAPDRHTAGRWATSIFQRVRGHFHRCAPRRKPSIWRGRSGLAQAVRLIAGGEG